MQTDDIRPSHRDEPDISVEQPATSRMVSIEFLLETSLWAHHSPQTSDSGCSQRKICIVTEQQLIVMATGDQRRLSVQNFY